MRYSLNTNIKIIKSVIFPDLKILNGIIKIRI